MGTFQKHLKRTLAGNLKDVKCCDGCAGYWVYLF